MDKENIFISLFLLEMEERASCFPQQNSFDSSSFIYFIQFQIYFPASEEAGRRKKRRERERERKKEENIKEKRQRKRLWLRQRKRKKERKKDRNEREREREPKGIAARDV